MTESTERKFALISLITVLSYVLFHHLTPKDLEVELRVLEWSRSITLEQLSWRRTHVGQSQLPDKVQDARCEDGWCSYTESVWTYARELTVWGSTSSDRDNSPSKGVYWEGAPRWPDLEYPLEEGCVRERERKEIYRAWFKGEDGRVYNCTTSSQEVWSRLRLEGHYTIPKDSSDCADLEVR